jgi:hypothetical protein
MHRLLGRIPHALVHKGHVCSRGRSVSCPSSLSSALRRRTEVEQVLCLPQNELDIQRLLLHREQCQRDDLLRGEAASLALIDC